MIRLSPQQKDRAFTLFATAKLRGELDDYPRLATANGVSLLELDEEIWAYQPEEGAFQVGEVTDDGVASIYVEVAPNHEHNCTDWWDSLRRASGKPLVARQVEEADGPCQFSHPLKPSCAAAPWSFSESSDWLTVSLWLFIEAYNRNLNRHG